MNNVRRIKCGDWFIQSCKCNKSSDFIAWASENPSSDVLVAEGNVYFNFSKTENEAIRKTMEDVKNNKKLVLL